MDCFGADEISGVLVVSLAVLLLSLLVVLLTSFSASSNFLARVFASSINSSGFLVTPRDSLVSILPSTISTVSLSMVVLSISSFLLLLFRLCVCLGVEPAARRRLLASHRALISRRFLGGEASSPSRMDGNSSIGWLPLERVAWAIGADGDFRGLLAEVIWGI